MRASVNKNSEYWTLHAFFCNLFAQLTSCIFFFFPCLSLSFQSLLLNFACQGESDPLGFKSALKPLWSKVQVSPILHPPLIMRRVQMMDDVRSLFGNNPECHSTDSRKLSKSSCNILICWLQHHMLRCSLQAFYWENALKNNIHLTPPPKK